MATGCGTVLFCGAFDDGDGYPRTAALRRGLEQHGVEVAECRVPALGRDKQRLLAEPWRWPAAAWRQRARRRELQRQLALAQRRHRPDVILVPYPGHLVAPAIRRLAQAPVVLDLFLSAYDTAVVDRALVPPGSLRAHLLRRLDRAACRAADLVLLDTEANADFVAALTGVPRSRFAVVPIADPGAPAVPPPFVPPSRGELPVLFFGTGVPLHGLVTLVDAVARTPAARLVLVGGTPQERELATARLGDRLDLRAPFVPRAELDRLLAEAVLVAGVFGTGAKAQRVVPFKVVHALAAGRPVVTADTPPLRDVLQEGHGGFLVPAGDAAALAARLAELAAHPDALQQAAAAARGVHDRHFATTVIGHRLKELLHAVPHGLPREAAPAAAPTRRAQAAAAREAAR